MTYAIAYLPLKYYDGKELKPGIPKHSHLTLSHRGSSPLLQNVAGIWTDEVPATLVQFRIKTCGSCSFTAFTLPTHRGTICSIGILNRKRRARYSERNI